MPDSDPHSPPHAAGLSRPEHEDPPHAAGYVDKGTNVPRWRRFLRRVWRVLVVTTFVLLVLWGTGAILWSNLPGVWLRPILAIAWVGLSVWALRYVRPRWRGVVAFGVMFVVLVLLWRMIPASNNRDWAPEYAVLPYADIDGDKVTIHNIRDFNWRSDTDFDERYYDRTFDLKDLRTTDLYISYFGPKAICHTMLAFGFGDVDPQFDFRTF